MIRLATVFSGIGAIEHALERMGINYKIIFACDNGDVDIFNRSIGINIDSLNTEITSLKNTIHELQINKSVENLYKQQLFNMLNEANKEFSSLFATLSSIDECPIKIEDILTSIVEADETKSARRKKYLLFKNELQVGSVQQKRLKTLQAILKISNDSKKDNNSSLGGGEIEQNESSNDIKWKSINIAIKTAYDYLETNNGKKIIRKVQDLSQRASQLHEKINYLKIQKQLEQFGNNWSKRKTFVDELYKGLESRNKVKQSYMANYKLDEKNFHWNVAFLNGTQYRGQVDLFVGGSPCQSFSLVGKQRGLEDTRGTLFYEYARLINEIRPKIFIYENVRAVLSHNDGKTWKKMQEVFSELGYVYKHAVLNAKDFGIPQNRERVFVIGFRNDIAPQNGFEFPEPVKLQKRMQDFLLDNAPGGYFLPAKGVNFVTKEKNLEKRFTQIDGNIQLCQKKNQQFNWHGDFVFQSEEDAKKHKIPDLEKYFLSEKVRKYVLSSGTKGFYSKPATDLDIARPLLTTMHKMHRAGVDNYVTTQGRLRKLTPRECLRLMGFSDDFKIVVPDTPMYQQAGNSIVVDVLIAILNKIEIEKYGDKNES